MALRAGSLVFSRTAPTVDKNPWRTESAGLLEEMSAKIAEYV